MKNQFCLFLMLLFLSTMLNAQSGFMQFTSKNGLTQNAVTCIFKDKRGFVWIGTQDGLNQFDGQKIQQYRHIREDSTTISDQYITSINEDGEGNIWVGTRNGLNRLNIQSNLFTRIHFNGIRKSQIQYAFDNIMPFESNNLLITVENKAYVLNSKTQQFFELPSSFRINSSFILKDKSIWQYSNGVFLQVNPINGLILDSTKSNNSLFVSSRLFIDNDGLIWVVDDHKEGSHQISFFDTRTKKWSLKTISWPEKINQIVFDNENTAWIATQSGVSVISKNGIKSKFINRQFPSILNQPNAVLAIYPDREGLIWMGFANNGALMFNPNSKGFTLIQPAQRNETVFSYAEDLNGNEWIAAISGLYKRQKEKEKFSLVLKEKVRTLLSDSLGNIWASSDSKGLFVIRKSGKIELVASVDNGKLIDNTIFHLSFDTHHSRLFISTKFGLVIADLKQNIWNVYHSKMQMANRRLSGSYILHSFIDSKGNAWISSNEGLDVLDKDLRLIYKYNSGTDTSTYIKRTIITGCTEDKNGQIWIATLSNGIYKWGKDKFEHFNLGSGLSSNVVSGILVDDKNKLWVATTAGMNVFDQQSKHFYLLTEQNGLPATDFLLGSLRKNKNNELFMCSSEGLVMIQPQIINLTPQSYKTFISKPLINYMPVPISENYSLSSEDKSISFELSAPCFVNADKLIYQYRLIGFDERWISLNSNDRRINYTNLPYTHLQLELRTASSNDLLSVAPISVIKLYRNPPLWRRWYFISFVFILFLIIVYLIIRGVSQRRINIEKRKAEIEQQLYKERERISRDLHDHLGTYAAAIKSNIVQLEKNEPKINSSIKQLKENAEDMVNALRETIWVMQYEHISITSLSDRLKNLVNRIAPNYPSVFFDIKEEIQTEKLLSPGVSIHLLRILQEILTNSLKHSNCSKIEISIKVNDTINIALIDNGIGFDINNNASGYGLQNIQERALESGLKVTIDSAMNVGTTVYITD